jgi:hypothetical protein
VTYLLEADLVEDCRKAAVTMSVAFERIGQRDARKAGSDRGAPDVLVSARGRLVPCEFKRPKDQGGRFSLDQLVAAEKRRRCGVETYAPTSLPQFVALLNWLRCGTGPVCPSCPTVPSP